MKIKYIAKMQNLKSSAGNRRLLIMLEKELRKMRVSFVYWKVYTKKNYLGIFSFSF